MTIQKKYPKQCQVRAPSHRACTVVDVKRTETHLNASALRGGKAESANIAEYPKVSFGLALAYGPGARTTSNLEAGLAFVYI